MLPPGVQLFMSFFLSICYYFSVCRVLEQTHLLTSFGRAVGFLSDLTMCVAVKRRLFFVIEI